MKIKFTQNPTGKYKLAYSEGDVCDMPDGQAALLINEGYATPIIDEPAAEEKKEEPKEEKKEEPKEEKPVVETASFGLNKKEKKGK